MIGDYDSKVVAHHEYVEFFAEPGGRLSLVTMTESDSSSMSCAIRSEQHNMPLAAEGSDIVTLRSEP